MRGKRSNDGKVDVMGLGSIAEGVVRRGRTVGRKHEVVMRVLWFI